MDSCINTQQVHPEIGVGLSFEKASSYLSAMPMAKPAEFILNTQSLSNLSEDSADPASPVEAARLQAERAASNYASARKTGASFGSIKPSKSTGQNSIRGAKKGQPSTDINELSFGSCEDEEGGKSDIYQRRLALNRESAAVSRIRRREYIRQLEERLARVETHKNQLIGQVGTMVQQNKQMSEQLTACFQLMAANQRPNQENKSDRYQLMPVTQRPGDANGLP